MNDSDWRTSESSQAETLQRTKMTSPSYPPSRHAVAATRLRRTRSPQLEEGDLAGGPARGTLVVVVLVLPGVLLGIGHAVDA